MIIYFYSLVPLLFLPTDSSSIRDRNFKNDLVPLFGSRLDSSKKDANSLKIVSNEPFIIQLQVPNSGENTRKSGKEKDTKRKRPTKKRISKLKSLRKRHRQRRDLQPSKTDPDRERKSDRLEIVQTGKLTDHQSENTTKNAISRTDILKALSAYTKKREAKKSKKDLKNFHPGKEKGTETAKHVSDKTPEVQRLSSSPVVKMVYPSAPKPDKHLHKYSYKDLMSDRERLEKKIKYIRNMMNLSAVDDAIRVRRRSESDRTANKIAKMFLTLSAVNGLHDKLRSKCDDDEDDENNYEDGYGFLEKESQENPSKRSFSSNEERYKVKKWIEHMKNKRSSSKTCPCMAKEHEEERDVFPLEQKLPRNYFLLQKGGGSEESSEAYGDLPRFHREKSGRSNHNKRRNHKAREDQENKLKALAGKGKKLELPLDDLELYRLKAKQILQNAEEILDKIKEEEEKRLTSPNLLMNQLKELTSRIQTDPRHNENDLIRKLQKSIGLGSASKSSDGTDGSGFLDNVKSFILDPYEKAKALTDESTKKLSSYLLRNLGELQEPAELREDADDKDDKDILEKYFGQIPSKEEDKPQSVSLAKENIDEIQPYSKEIAQNWTDTVSFTSAGGDENKKIEDLNNHPNDQFKKRMEEIMKEQERKLNGYEGSHESEESSKENANRVGDRKEEEGGNEIVELKETLKEDETSAPLQQKKDEAADNRDSKENYKTAKVEKGEPTRNSTSRESDYVSEKEVSEEAVEERKIAHPKDEVEKDLLEELLQGHDEKEKSAKPEVAMEHKESGVKEGDEKANSANEESDAVESVHEKSNEEEEIPEVIAAATREETGLSNVDPKRESDDDDVGIEESDEKIGAKKLEQSKEYKSDEESMLEEQQETQTDPQLNSADTEETVAVKDPEINKEDESSKETDQNIQTQKTQKETEPHTGEENSTLLKEANPDESLEKMKSNEEEDEAEAEKNEKEDTLQLETPAEGHKQEENVSGEENKDVETSDDDQLSKALVKDDEDQGGLSGATNEGFHENKKAVSDNQDEQNISDESPLGSATSKEFLNETLLRQQSDEDGEEISQKNENHTEEVSDKDGSGTLLKQANEEVQEFSDEEETAPLKATMNNQSNEKYVDVNTDDKTLGMTATSEEKVSEALETAESSNEAPLKSTLEPDAYNDESNRMTADDEDVEGETDDKLRSAKPGLDINDGDSGASEEKEGNEVVSETQKEEGFDEGEEVRLEAKGPTEEQDRATQNPDSAAIRDDVLRKENSEVRLSHEREDEDTLSKASDGQDLENIKDDSEEISSGKLEKINKQDEKDAVADGSVKAALEEKDRENFDEDDKVESSLNNEDSDEKLKMIEEPSENDAVGKPKEAGEDSNDRTLENEDVTEEISLKATNNAEEDGEFPLQATLEDQDQEMISQTDDEAPLQSAKDADKQEEDKSNADDTLMKSSSKDDQISLKEDETPLKSTLNDEVAKEAEENQDKSKEISDDTPLGVTSNKDNEESLENVEETLLEEIRNNDEESLETETPLRAVNVEKTLNEEGKGSENKSDEKAPDTDGVMEDDKAEVLRAKNPSEAYRESGALDEENPLRAANFEDFSNNIQDDDETLRATDDLKHPESLKDSEESLREVNIPGDLNNQIDEQNEDETPLQSVKSSDEMQEDPEEGYESLRKEKPSIEDQITSAEDEFPLTASDQVHQSKFEKDSKEEITPENLREVHSRKNPLKANTLKVPKSIGKIMRDLEGPQKDDITALENLNPEKIDHIIDKIDEVEQQNKVTDDVDCRKECACAEDINVRSRKAGRYEIVKDFLQWMKDLQLNRVLSDD